MNKRIVIDGMDEWEKWCQRGFLDVATVAMWLGVSRQRVRHMMENGKYQGFVVNGRLMMAYDDVQDWQRKRLSTRQLVTSAKNGMVISSKAPNSTSSDGR